MFCVLSPPSDLISLVGKRTSGTISKREIITRDYEKAKERDECDGLFSVRRTHAAELHAAVLCSDASRPP